MKRNLKRILSVLLVLSLMLGVAAVSAAAVRSQQAYQPAAVSPTSEKLWYHNVSPFTAFILKWLCFGWLWMRPYVPPPEPPTDPPTEPTTKMTEPPTDPPDAPKWTVALTGFPGKSQFTDQDAAALEFRKVRVFYADSIGRETDTVYGGVRVADIFAACGVDPATLGPAAVLLVTASDGESAGYTREVLVSNNTLLAWERDGDALDEPRFCPGDSKDASQYLKYVAEFELK